MKNNKTPLVKKYREFLFLLTKLSTELRNKLIKDLKGCHINCLAEIFNNFLNKRLTTDPKIILKLKKFQTEINKVARKRTPIYIKKRVLLSKRGGSILSILLPIAANLVSSLTS